MNVMAMRMFRWVCNIIKKDNLKKVISVEKFTSVEYSLK